MQMVTNQSVSRENDVEVEETAPIREILCEPSGHGILNEIDNGDELVQRVTGLNEPFCVDYERPGMGLWSRIRSFFE